MSSASKSEVIKQPIKYLEIPINKFNDVAIPHHLDLLKKHKNNIKRVSIYNNKVHLNFQRQNKNITSNYQYQAVRDWDRVYTEQINASRIVKQLKQLLHEMDTLRGQVLDRDIATFDKLIAKSRTSLLNAIKEYLGWSNTSVLQQLLHLKSLPIHNALLDLCRPPIKSATRTTFFNENRRFTHRIATR